MQYKSHQGTIHHPSRYLKIPYDLADLERVIVQYPNETKVDEAFLDRDKFLSIDKNERTFKEFNEAKIRIHAWTHHKWLLWTGIGSFIFVAFFQFVFSYVFIWPVWLLIGLPAMWVTYLGIKLPKNPTIAFHRDKGLLELYGALWDKLVIQKFDDAYIRFAKDGGSYTNQFEWSIYMHRYHKASYKNMGVSIAKWSKGKWETWSFWVWYMDKNRPLPPGTAFDEYQKADFEHRKAEDFPPPLYKGRIPTPEVTPEQQAEREKYWKDTYHMVS